MNGTIVNCIASMVTEKFGMSHWKSVLVKSGLEEETKFSVLDEVEDETVMSLLKNASEVLNVPIDRVFELFAEYWVNTYAQKKYYMYFKSANNAREFFKQMNGVHDAMTDYLANARPPRFEIREVSKNTITMQYKSERKLYGLFLALVVATAAYYKEEVTARWLSDDELEITFAE